MKPSMLQELAVTLASLRRQGMRNPSRALHRAYDVDQIVAFASYHNQIDTLVCLRNRNAGLYREALHEVYIATTSLITAGRCILSWRSFTTQKQSMLPSQ
jgi:hypothetical protein